MDYNECRNNNIWVTSCNQKKYGCHRPQVPEGDFYSDLTERICVYCYRRRPVSLEELAVLVLLRNIELLKNFAQSHHPQRIYWIIGRAINAKLRFKASELAEFIPKDSEPSLALFDVEPDKEIILKRFLFYCSVYHKLKEHMENPSDLIKKIVKYLENFDNEYYDFWQIMRSAMQSAEFNYQDRMLKSGFMSLVISAVNRILPWIDNEALSGALMNASRPTSAFRSTITSVAKIFLPWLDNEILNITLSSRSQPVTDGRNIIDIYVKIPEIVNRFYKPGINFGEQEYVAMKELLQMQKRPFACPVVFKTKAIADLTFLPQDVASLLQNVDPQWISYVALTTSSPWSVANIDELGRVLSACKNLSFIHLRQLPNTETPEDIAAAVSRVLYHHPQLQALGFEGFPFGEMMERYPLPPVAELGLYDCGLTDADWKFMASRSDFALRELSVSSLLPLPPSLYDFILKQATSLEGLSLHYLTLMTNQVCDLMTSIAKFNTLQHLHVSYSHLDLVNTSNILLAFIPIASAEKLAFQTPDEMPERELLMSYLLMQMKTFCALNRRMPVCLSLTDESTQLGKTIVMTPWHN